MKVIYCLMIFLCPMVSGAQEVKALTVGDKVPDIKIENIYNSSSSPIHLADLHGKLVVLDFMATTCVPCVRALPKLNALQKKYSKQLQVVLISSEEAGRIKTFLNNHNTLRLPIAADSNAAKFFPHSYISHVVWIDPNGIVCAITHPERVNAKDIESILNGEKVNWPVKRDLPDFDFTQPLFQLNYSKIPKEAEPVRSSYTSIVSYMPGVPKYSKITMDTLHHTSHFSFINYSRFELFKILFNCFQIPLSHVLIKGPIKDQLIYDSTYGYFESWKRKNVYSLEATLPAGMSAREQRNQLLQDIGFYFGMQASMEKRFVNCLVLKNGATATPKPSVKDGLFLGSVVGTLNHRLSAIPAIDETKGKSTLVLPFTEDEVANNSYLRKTLAEYGIEITNEKREIEFLVIKQANVSAN